MLPAVGVGIDGESDKEGGARGSHAEKDLGGLSVPHASAIRAHHHHDHHHTATSGILTHELLFVMYGGGTRRGGTPKKNMREQVRSSAGRSRRAQCYTKF